jgi:dTDP-4-dehydrorhamnose 3,5-epimerase
VTGWQSLPGGAWLFGGEQFADPRGESLELVDLSQPDLPVRFVPVQENLVRTREAGCARGLHYQVGEYAQAKLVTVLRGTAQFFWLPLRTSQVPAVVRSAVLPAGATSLFTPADSAHGFLALEDNTAFLMRMSAPVSLPHRGEIGLLSSDLALSPARPFVERLLSERDKAAPGWLERRQS